MFVKQPSRIAIALAISTIACGLPTAPDPGTDYALLTIDGRPVPTWATPQAPQDSVYPVILGQEFDVTSNSRMNYSVWVGEAHRNADGGVTYAMMGCWQGFALDYHQHADTLFLALAHDVVYANPPTVPPILLVQGPNLVQPLISGVVLRYVPAHPITMTC